MTGPPRRPRTSCGQASQAAAPHIAWATGEARRRLLDVAVANVAGFLAGRATKVVNRARDE